MISYDTERVRFERDFKPKLARLIAESFPGWKFKAAIQEAQINRMGERVFQLQVTLVDGIFGLELEVMQPKASLPDPRP